MSFFFIRAISIQLNQWFLRLKLSDLLKTVKCFLNLSQQIHRYCCFIRCADNALNYLNNALTTTTLMINRVKMQKNTTVTLIELNLRAYSQFPNVIGRYFWFRFVLIVYLIATKRNRVKLFSLENQIEFQYSFV